MGWRYIGQNTNIKLFSVAGELKEITEAFIGFALGFAPGVYVLLIFTVIAMFILYMFFYIARAIKHEDV